MLTTLALPGRYLGQTVSAVTKAKMPVLVWLEFQDCAGCTESMLRSSAPDVASAVLDLLSWECHETIMAGPGTRANVALDRVVKEEKGKYLLVEGGFRPMTAACIAPSAGARRWTSPQPFGVQAGTASFLL